MTLASTKTLVTRAAEQKTGIGAFNVLHLETAEALVHAAEEAQLPVILQISQNCVNYHGSIDPIAMATLALAKASSAQVAVHLDHCEDVALAHHAVDLGFSSVMFDGSWLPYEDNIRHTREVVDYAHSHGCDVEAELGEIGGKLGAHAPGVRTKPAEAHSFATATNVDFLAVAVGSEHAMQSRTATLDLDLIQELNKAVEAPLVLHGSSGVPDEQIVQGIHAGMTKINVSTHLNGFFTRAIRAFVAENPEITDSRKYMQCGREALSQEAERLLKVFAGKK